jgi:oligopeptide transport system substrate-binding protein
MARFATLTIATTVVASAGACHSGCSCNGAPGGEYYGPVPTVVAPDHLRYCNGGEPETLDPAMASSTIAIRVINELFDGLTAYDANGQPEPGLATRWEVSEDGREVRFHMHDRARWSNGRPVTAYDVAYQIVRVLHPLTASPNAGTLYPLHNAAAFTAGTARELQHAVGPLSAGDLVEIVTVNGLRLDDVRAGQRPLPDSNLRRSTRTLALRDLGEPAAAAYASLAPGADVTLVELSGEPASPPAPDGAVWAYVFARETGVYGWVPANDLDVSPNGEVHFGVVQVPPPASAEVVEVRGRDLLHLPEIVGVRVMDAATLVLRTTAPTPYLLDLTASALMRPSPREAVSRRPQRWAEPGTIVTSGPMRLVAWSARDHIELVRAPGYWNAAAVHLTRLTFLSLDDRAANANVYRQGGCDAVAASYLPPELLPILDGTATGAAPRRDYQRAPLLGTYGLVFNTKRIANRNLRRALAMAIDRAPLPRLLQGGELSTASMVPGIPVATLDPEDRAACGSEATGGELALVLRKGTHCYLPAPGLAHDVEAARAALRAASQDGPIPSLAYRYIGANPVDRRIAEYLRAQWQSALGIAVTLEAQEWATLRADVRAGNFDIARLGIAGAFADPTEFLSVFSCAPEGNRAHWCQREFEAAMVAAAQPNGPDRNRALRQAEALVLAEAVAIPLYVYMQHHLRRPYVRGLPINVADRVALHRVWLDPTWSRPPSTRSP